MKKIPKFWKIYIFAVTVTVMLCIIALIVLGGYLKSYEYTAVQNAKAAEAHRLFEEKENAERQSGVTVSKRLKLISAVKEAGDMAAAYADSSVGLSAAEFMDALVASLNENGISGFSDKIDCRIGKYEDPASVTKYIDDLPGEYSHEKISAFVYSLTKGTLTSKVTLSEGENNDKGHKTFVVSSISVSLPLMSCRVSAPEEATLKVNGMTVDDEPVLEDPNVPDLIPSSFKISKTALYVFEGFIYRPQIKAYIGEDECMPETRTDRTAYLYPSNGKYRSTLVDRVFLLSFAYSDYVAGSVKFEEIKDYLYPDTKFYGNLAGFDTRWYYDYTSLENANAVITNFTVLSDRLVFAEVTYDQLLYRGTRVYKTVPIKLRVYMGCEKTSQIKDPDGWRLIFVESAE